MPEPFQIALFGAAGRMGQEIMRQAWRFPSLKIVRGYDVAERVETPELEPTPSVLPHDIQGALDFSLAEAVPGNLALALSKKIPYVCGVTGLSDVTMQKMAKASEHIPLLYSTNMSPGMTVMHALAALTAKALPHYERHIVEIHHTAKRDAPSGTALSLAKAMHDATAQKTEITALRMGEVTGEHRLILAGPGERLELVHHAESRAVFASGALRAMEWLMSKNAGFYKMSEVLGV